jgi:transcriptional regulator with XRE-family HTH domain
VTDNIERLAIARQFGLNLRRERLHAGYSQDGFAEICGLHRTEISKIERGERTPRVDTVIRLVGALEITANDLLIGMNWQTAYREKAPRAGTFFIYDEAVGST